MKMKRLLAASALCAMTLALAACGGKKEAAKSGGAWKPEKDIHVIPQGGCATSTATRLLLHLPSSAPSTAALAGLGSGG